MSSRRERREAQRFSAQLRALEQRAGELCQDYDSVLKQPQAQSLRLQLLPIMEDVSAAIREQAMAVPDLEAMEEFLLAGRGAAEWLGRLCVKGADVRARYADDPAATAETEEILALARVLLNLLVKQGMAAPDTTIAEGTGTSASEQAVN